MNRSRSALNVEQLESRDVPASLSISDLILSEGHSGTKTATLTVQKSANDTRPVTVRVATSDGSARAGQDYNATSVTLTFNPGQTAKTVSVSVRGDKTSERDETCFVTLSSPTNATIGKGTGKITITNDDPRTFFFFFGGFTLSSGNNSGLESLRTRLLGDSQISSNAVFTSVAYFNSDVVAARSSVTQTLDAQLVTTIDRVVLIGHSYGGNMAYTLASDVDGRGRAASAIATLDPIDWNNIGGGGFGYEKALPQGLAAANVLNLVQRTGLLQGFVIAPRSGVVNENVTTGPDGILGTSDDLSHTTLDDSVAIQTRVQGFVRQYVWG